MPLPTFPPVDVAALTAPELGALAAWLTESAAAVAAEQARRADVHDRVRRAAAYRIALAGGDDPRWTPHPWDGARLAAGPDAGRQGFIVGRCTDGCEQIDGQPRWRLRGVGGLGTWSCLTREHLRPVPTVRRPGAPGRLRCDYPCRCCMGDPTVRLARTSALTR